MLAFITELTTENYDSFTTNEGVNLVEITTTWCPQCKVLGPIIDEISAEERDIRFGMLNAEPESHLSFVKENLGVRNVPTSIIFKDGVEVERFIGAKPKNEIISILDKYKNHPTEDSGSDQ